MIYILTTVGTSIITNNLKKIDPKFQDWFTSIQSSNLLDDKNSVFIELREKIKELGGIKKNKDYKLSAEISSLQKINETNKKEQDIRVKFILTDTAAAQASTILLEDFFHMEPMFNQESIRERFNIEGLQVKDFKQFEEKGLLNLITQVSNLKQEFDKSSKGKDNDKIILNLTGGYKGMIPFLTLFGQLYEIEINYLYEMSDDLIKFPQLPIQFDWLKSESYYNYLSNKINYDENDYMFQELAKNYLIKVQDDNKSYTLTSVGQLFYDYIKEKVIVDDRVMGHTMEYKLLEYYLDKPYQNKYLYLKRSVPLVDPEFPNDKSKKSDIDLLMKENKDSNEFISIECKPYIGIESAFEDESRFIKQLKFQLELFTKNNYFPKEYLLHIYVDNEKVIRESIKKNLKFIKDIIAEKTPQITFKAFIFSTNILDSKVDKSNPNLYSNFMSRKLTEVREYNIF